MAVKPFESRIQDLVYNVDVGIGLRLIKLSLYIMLVLIIMLLYTVSQFKGLNNAEAMDYAQLGRNLEQTHEFTTQCVRPASMWYLKTHAKDHNPHIDRHPDILHAPLYPALLAAGFHLINYDFNQPVNARIFPPEQWVIVPIGHLFSLLTGLLVFLTARHLFDRRVAWVGMSLFFLSDLVWKDSVSGTGLPVVTFFTLLSFYAALLATGRTFGSEDPVSFRRTALFFVLSVVSCTLAILTRYGAVALVPALILFYGLSIPRKGWLWGGAFILLVALGMTPWLLRNIAVSGGFLGLAPYTALAQSTLFSGDTLERTFAPVFSMGEVINALKIKFMSRISQLYNNPLRTLGDGVLMGFFIATFFYRFARPQVKLLRWPLAVGLLCSMVLAALFGDSTTRLLHIYWPLILLYGLVFFFVLLDQLDFEFHILNLAITGGFCMLCVLPLVFSLLPPRVGIPYPPYFAPYIRHVCMLLEPTELICTDMPWATAWYGQRNSLLLPADLNEFYEINDYTKRVSGLYFTTITRNKQYVSELLTGPYKTWFPIMEGRIPADFPLSQGFPIGDMNQLFLTDRRRWEE